MARRRARENPIKTRDKALIAGGGILALGLGIFLLTRSSSASTGGAPPPPPPPPPPPNGSDGGGGGGQQGPPAPPPVDPNQKIYDAAKSAYNSSYAANIGMGNEASASLAGFLAAVQAAIGAGAKQTIDGVNVATQVTHDAFIANGKTDFAASLLAAAARTAAGLG